MKTFLPLLVLTMLCGIGTAAAEPLAEAQKIDTLLAADWDKHSLQGNPAASDELLVRRLHLDLVGRIPTHRETTEFLADTAPDKRSRLIDRLLASEGFTLHQFHFYADLLRVLSKGTYPGDAGRVTGTAYAEYIKDSIRQNKPWDRFVRELVSAQGVVWDNGAVGYYARDRAMPLDNLATTMRIFMGTRIECAQCHNHPFDSWTQMQFHQMAAYTYGVQTVMGIYTPSFTGMLQLMMDRRKQNGTSPDAEVHLRQALNEMIVPVKHAWISHAPQRLKLPHDYQYTDAKPGSFVQPATLMGKAAPYDPKGNPLNSFADWLVSPDNPRFATVMANRLWKKLFGLGLIEPVDDIPSTPTAMNPELMEHLRQLMIAQQFDVKAFLRVLCHTQAYQREVTQKEWPLGEPYHFTGPLLRRMTPEQMWDSFITLIQPAPDLPNLPLREATDVFLANARKLGTALEKMPSAELLERADLTSEIFRKNVAQFKVLQQQIAEAQKREDKAAVAKFARELGALRKTEIATADENIYIPAVLKLSSDSRQKGTSYKDVEAPGFMPPDRSQEKAAQTQLWLAEAARIGMPEAQRATFVKYQEQMQRLWPRAAELESPAPVGHPLREFGQSDRDVVENSNHDASVPQVLLLMNGQLSTHILNGWSQLKQSVKQSKYPDDRVEAVYLALLSRHPTATEKARWVQSGSTDLDDLIYALLNTRQFIFVQ